MKAKRQYLIVDTKKCRRHSAPENLNQWFDQHQRDAWCRASVADFSVLLENQSESGSSLELDTSNLSRDLSPIPTTKTTPGGSYQSLPDLDFGASKKTFPDDHWHGFGSWLTWKNILLSQAIAGCIAIMNASNTGLRNSKWNVPTSGQNLLHYIFLGVLWTTKLALRNNGRDIIHVIKYSGLRYLFLSVLHVEANYLLLSSFHHDTYLGNQMIDCVAAFLCLIVTYVCLDVQFHLMHAFGVALITVGAIGLLIANAVYRNQNREDALLGDVLRIISGICLAFNSIAQEIIVKSIDCVEYMGMIGLIGSFICGFQAMIMEANKVVLRTSAYWLNLVSYSLAQFLLNSLTPKALHEMGAPGLHLALTASEFYSYSIEAIYQQEKMHILYFISYAMILTGSVLFFVKRTIIEKETFFPVKIPLIKEN